MNIMWMPNSPIKDLTIQYAGKLNKDSYEPGEQFSCVPSFLGYGTKGALSRFKVFLPSLRDPKKRHPASIGKRKGLNNSLNKNMDISAKFVGNFTISGYVRDANNTPIANCTIKLFREDGDLLVDTESSDANGIFTVSVPNDSYKRYYITAKRTDVTNTVGISSYILTPVQV